MRRILILVMVLGLSPALAFVPHRKADGNARALSSATITINPHAYGINEIPGDLEYDAIDQVAGEFNEVAGSSLNIIIGEKTYDEALDSTLNIIQFVNDPEYFNNRQDQAADTVLAFNEDGNIKSFDILINTSHFTWTEQQSTGYPGKTGPLSLKTVLRREIGKAIGLDYHAHNPDSAMFFNHPPGKDLSLGTLEEQFIRTTYPSDSLDTGISGKVTWNGQEPVLGAYVYAIETEKHWAYGSAVDSEGNYHIHEMEPGTYKVFALPYSTSPRITLSSYYRRMSVSNMDFVAESWPGGTITLNSGSTEDGISFTVDAAFEPENEEPNDSISAATPLPVSNTRQTGNHHSSDDVDWWRVETSSNCITILTSEVGVGVSTNKALYANITLSLHNADGSQISSNTSKDPALEDHRSAINTCPGPGTYYIKAIQADPYNYAAGAYYNIRALSPKEAGTYSILIDAITPRVVTEDGEVFVRIDGSNFQQGAVAKVISQDNSEHPMQDEAVYGCDNQGLCSTLFARIPAHPPEKVTVEVENPDSESGELWHGLAEALEYVALPFSFHDRTLDYMDEFVGEGKCMCWGFINDDPYPDLFRGTYNSYQPSTYTDNRVLINDGTGKLVDRTLESGISYTDFFPSSCSFADYDNDGDEDLYITTSSDAYNRLYRNDSSQESISFYLNSIGLGGTYEASKPDAVWLDYDKDGDLDVYVLNRNGPNSLYRNDTNDFNAVPDAAGAAGGESDNTSQRVASADFDGNGYPDLYIANVSGREDKFYLNHGGTFTDSTLSSGIIEDEHCMWIYAGFLNPDNDGLPDLLCSGDSRVGQDPSLQQKLWINEGDGTFLDHSSDSGIHDLGIYGSEVVIADLDNDSDDDLYFAGDWDAYSSVDFTMENDGASPPHFTRADRGVDEGEYTRDSEVANSCDIDMDGDVELLSDGSTTSVGGDPDDLYIWDNDTSKPGSNSHIELRLLGANTPADQDLSPKTPFNAIVQVIPDLGLGHNPTKEECKSITPQIQYKKQLIPTNHGGNPNTIWFGLVKHPKGEPIDCINITWPSGWKQTYTGISTGKVTITESSESLEVISVEPDTGPASGGDPVEIVAFNIDSGTSVHFGPKPATGCTLISAFRLRCNTPQGNLPGPVDVSVTNSSGMQGTLEKGYTFTSDDELKVLDPNPEFRDGSWISTDPEVLGSTGAREVLGAQADGSPLLIRLGVDGPGTVDFRIRDEAGGTDNIGNLSSSGGSEKTQDLTVEVTELSDGRYYAFAEYISPTFFARDEEDHDKKSREVTLEVIYHPTTGGEENFQKIIDIHRVVIFFVHGLWGDIKSFDWRDIETDPIFTVYKADYSNRDGSLGPLVGNAKRFDGNVNKYLPGAIEAALDLSRTRHKIAATQVAAVGHSMGGCITRVYAGHDDSPAWPDFYRDENFNLGDFWIHVTAATPHKGSPLADITIPIRDNKHIGPRFIRLSYDLDMPVDQGAVDDLATWSYWSRNAPATLAPAHAMVFKGGSDIVDMGIPLAKAVSRNVRNLERLLNLGGKSLTDLDGYHDLIVWAGFDLTKDAGSQGGGLNCRTTDLNSDCTIFSYKDKDDNAVHTGHGGAADSERAAERLRFLLNQDPKNSEVIDPSGFKANLPLTDNPSTDGQKENTQEKPSSSEEDKEQKTTPESFDSFSDDATLLLSKQSSDLLLEWDVAVASVEKSPTSDFSSMVYCENVSETTRSWVDKDANRATGKMFYRLTDGGPGCREKTEEVALYQVLPDTCATPGGMKVTLMGANFNRNTRVFIGNHRCTPVKILDSNYLECIAPGADTYGQVDVRVQNPSSTYTLTDGFTYTENQPLSVEILSPSDGSIFTAGQEVTVSVDAPQATEVLVLGHRSTSSRLFEPPWTTTITIDEDAAGAFIIEAVAYDSDRNFGAAEITVQAAIPGDAILTAIEATPQPMFLYAKVPKRSIRVVGHYTDGIERDITGASFTSEDNAVASVNGQGLVSSNSVGSCRINVSYQGKSDVVDVKVRSMQLILEVDHENLTWQDTASHSYDVVKGDLHQLLDSQGNFQTSIISCLASQTTMTSIPEQDPSSPEQAWFYLVRSRRTAGPNTWDVDWTSGQPESRDPEIAASPDSCP